MCSAKTRLFLTIALALGAAAPGWAQGQRPPATRAVPIDLVCGPHATLTAPVETMRIAGGVEPAKTLFAAGDTVLIDAGTNQGVSTGQQYFVRRVIADRFAVRTTDTAPLSIHTAGWLTVVETKDDVSIARVTEACDGVIEGDYLEPLVVPVAVAPLADGQPDYERPARVILADDRRQMGAGGGSLMVIDRGSDHGLRPGQRLTIFRKTLDGTGPAFAVGEAYVATIRPDTSVMRIQQAREAIHVGDLIAIHR